MRKSRFYLALLHYPMYNKRMDVITTSVSNLDLHDISRAAKTYGVENFFVVHPLEAQQKLVYDILHYWQEGYGSTYNEDRKEALSILKVVPDLPGVLHYIEQEGGHAPALVATDARAYPGSISYRNMKRLIWEEDRDILLLLGTGWGIESDLIAQCHYVLEPIAATSTYNHLSVRSAAAIILDRLLQRE